jgi:hypothetical protein
LAIKFLTSAVFFTGSKFGYFLDDLSKKSDLAIDLIKWMIFSIQNFKNSDLDSILIFNFYGMAGRGNKRVFHFNRARFKIYCNLKG